MLAPVITATLPASPRSMGCLRARGTIVILSGAKDLMPRNRESGSDVFGQDPPAYEGAATVSTWHRMARSMRSFAPLRMTISLRMTIRLRSEEHTSELQSLAY